MSSTPQWQSTIRWKVYHPKVFLDGKNRKRYISLVAVAEEGQGPCRIKIVRGMETTLMLWEVCFKPSLLHGAGTWTEISSKTEEEKNNEIGAKIDFYLNSTG